MRKGGQQLFTGTGQGLKSWNTPISNHILKQTNTKLPNCFTTNE